MKLLILIFSLFVTSTVADPYYGSIRASGDASNAHTIVWTPTVAENLLIPGILSETKMDFSTGAAGASFALYGVARGVGKVGTWGVHDVVGVHGTCYKDFNGWCAGVHADVYDSVPGGTAIGVNVELPLTQIATDTIGLNIQPSPNSHGITGIQLQYPEAYKYGIVAANMNFVFGMVDGTPFGMRFNKNTQRLEFFRNIGGVDEVRRGYIDMKFEQPDAQLN